MSAGGVLVVSSRSAHGVLVVSSRSVVAGRCVMWPSWGPPASTSMWGCGLAIRGSHAPQDGHITQHPPRRRASPWRSHSSATRIAAVRGFGDAAQPLGYAALSVTTTLGDAALSGTHCVR